MRRAFLVLGLLLLAVAAAQDSSEIKVYRRGRVLGYDKEVGETHFEALIETWSCATGKLEKTDPPVDVYYHLSEDGEVLTPRALCDRCSKRFVLEKAGTRWIFKGIRKPDEKSVAPVVSRVGLDADALTELSSKAARAAREIEKVDPREVGSATKRRKIIEDKGLQLAFDEWREDSKAALAVAKAIEGMELGAPSRAYVLRSFGWQRWHEHDARAAAVFYDACIRLAPSWSSAHYGLALVRKDEKDKEGELVELSRALRAKPRLKYARLVVDAARSVSRTDKLDEKALEKLRSGAEDAKARLEQSPPDTSGAAAAIEATIGKVLDERFPQPRGGGAPEPEEER